MDSDDLAASILSLTTKAAIFTMALWSDQQSLELISDPQIGPK